jgi:CheY-like chemotaxis protein
LGKRLLRALLFPDIPATVIDNSNSHAHSQEDNMVNPLPGSQRILVVDDNADGGRSLAMVLTTTGRDVRVVGDGPTALQTLEEFQPHVVVLDIGLPGMDGYEVARRIRQGPAAKVRLIAMTGSPPDEDRDMDFDHYFLKPINIEQLLAALVED